MFKVGDRVIIKTDITKYTDFFGKNMEYYKGKTATITRAYTTSAVGEVFTLDIGSQRWAWLDAWLDHAGPDFLTDEEINRINKLNHV